MAAAYGNNRRLEAFGIRKGGGENKTALRQVMDEEYGNQDERQDQDQDQDQFSIQRLKLNFNPKRNDDGEAALGNQDLDFNQDDTPESSSKGPHRDADIRVRVHGGRSSSFKSQDSSFKEDTETHPGSVPRYARGQDQDQDQDQENLTLSSSVKIKYKLVTDGGGPDVPTLDDALILGRG